MPAYARRQIGDESVVGVYHCMARCVRRAFLCGFDRYSGRNFDHRKAWVRQRLEELAGILAVDVLGFAVLGPFFSPRRRKKIEGKKIGMKQGTGMGPPLCRRCCTANDG